MKRGLETAVVLVLALVVLPVATVASMSASVPTALWVALLLACASYAPARAWAVRH